MIYAHVQVLQGRDDPLRKSFLSAPSVRRVLDKVAIPALAH
jgi:hypothetical protein